MFRLCPDRCWALTYNKTFRSLMSGLRQSLSNEDCQALNLLGLNLQCGRRLRLERFSLGLVLLIRRLLVEEKQN